MAKPKIRFKGYQDDWEQRKFIDIATRESSVCTSAVDIPSVEYEDVVSEEGRLNKDIRSKETVKSGITFDGSQVLYGKLRPYLHNWLNPDFKGIAVGDWWVLKPINMDKNFIYRLIQTQQFDNIANQSSGSKMPRADWNLISNSEFMVPPSKEEQNKIGRYFDSLDHLITLHQRKHLDLLKIRKNTWEQRKLGDVFRERIERATGDEELLSVTIANGVIRQADSEKRNIASEDKKNYKVVHQWDVPYNSMRMWQGAVGNSEYCGIVSPAYTVLIPTQEANGKFFMELFKKENSLKIFQRWSQGLTSDTWNLKYPVLSTIEFYIPKIDEQNKIATYFTTLDHLITLHQQK